MIDTSHPGTPPHGPGTASDPAHDQSHRERNMDVRRQVEEAMGASEDRWRTIFENASVGIAFTDPGGRFVLVNSAYQRMLGYSETELQRLCLADTTDQSSAEPTTAPQAEGPIHSDRLEMRCRRKDGREAWAEVSAFAVPSTGQPLVCLIAIDITRRKQAEEALGDAQADLAYVARLATMSELAASIAHEINQPIGAIATQAAACRRWLERDKPDLDRAREGLVRIEREARRAKDVVRGLTALAKKSRPRESEVDIDNAIEEVLSFVRSEIIQHGIALRRDLRAGNRSVYGDRVQLQQVLLNLIMNSVEAMSATADLPRILSISSEPTATGGMLIAVEDTGAGLDPTIADRVFDGFFTTKPDGMGMGLSICRSIIEAHGGRIWASPCAPHGATFQFILPALYERELRGRHGQPCCPPLSRRVGRAMPIELNSRAAMSAEGSRCECPNLRE